MNNTEKLIIENFEDRFKQVKGISDFIKSTSEENLGIITKIKESEDFTPKSHESELVTFKKNEMSMTLLNQQLQSLITRVVEYYSIIKMNDLPTSLTSEDEKFLEGFMKQKLDLFGVEKGELVVLNKEFHEAVMANIAKMKEGEAEQVLEYIKTLK